jgi:hypothetical protein
MDEIYGFSNPYDDYDLGYWESEAKYRQLEEELEQETMVDFFNEVVEKILGVIRDTYRVYPTISMLRDIEMVVEKISRSGHRLSRNEAHTLDSETDGQKRETETFDFPVIEDNDVPF